MVNCLGIYSNNNVIKYAKVSKDNNGTIEISDHGVRFVKTDIISTIKDIVAETNSMNIPIAFGNEEIQYSTFQTFKQIAPNDIGSIVNLEFEDWCEKNTKSPLDTAYVYKISENLLGDYHKAIMALMDKSVIQKFADNDNKDINISAIYPTEIITYNTVPEEEKNYLLVNLDDHLTLTLVLNGKPSEYLTYDIGMKKIFSKFTELAGTYQKAYETCKSLNVYSELGEDESDKIKFEEVLEPILQEVLKIIAEVVSKNQEIFTKIYITGSSTLFTNLDTLFTEYIGVKSEILKPDFVTNIDSVKNVAEILETLPAMVLAYQYLFFPEQKLNFLKKKIKGSFFETLFGPKKEKTSAKNIVVKKQPKVSNVNFNNLGNLENIIIYPLVILPIFIVSYFVFTNIFFGQIESIKGTMSNKNNEYKEMASTVSNDLKIITDSTNEYKKINEEVKTVKDQIESGKIGKFTTYNVASFMQRIIKIIPKNVQLKTISSDDNKKVTIVATSDQYQSLGYFISNLRLQNDVIANVAIKNITNGDTITVEIGGELP